MSAHLGKAERFPIATANTGATAISLWTWHHWGWPDLPHGWTVVAVIGMVNLIVSCGVHQIAQRREGL